MSKGVGLVDGALEIEDLVHTAGDVHAARLLPQRVHRLPTRAVQRSTGPPPAGTRVGKKIIVLTNVVEEKIVKSFESQWG